MSDDVHKFDKDWVGLHEKIGGDTEGGACLARHEPYNENSCSHQWQAYEKGLEHSGMYNYPAYESVTEPFATAGWETSGGTYPMVSRKLGILYPLAMDPPQPGDWDIGRGKSKTFQTSSGSETFENFKTFTVPYWHNAHHIIPHSVLNNAIREETEDLELRGYLMARGALLKAKYNLNHKHNMVILPQGKRVAQGLSLPRHVSGTEAEPGVDKETADHKKYSRNVKSQVIKAMGELISKIEEALKNKDHDKVPDGNPTRRKLEKISNKIFKAIKDFGQSSGGEALTQMPRSSFDVL
jgi:hypothetical protein